MNLLAEVEVAAEGMLEKMDEQISAEHPDRSLLANQGIAFGEHFQKRSGQHEPGAQRHEVAQIEGVPGAAHYHPAAGNIGRGGHQAQ